MTQWGTLEASIMLTSELEAIVVNISLGESTDINVLHIIYI